MKIKSIFSLTLLLATPFAFSMTGAVKPSVTTVAPKATSEVKVGYFNSAQVVSESKMGKEAFAEMEKKRQGFEEDFKKDEAAYTKKIKDLQTKAPTMSMTAKQKAEEDLMKSKRNLEDKARGYEEDLKLAMNQAQAKIGKYLAEAVMKYGKAEGKDLMVDIVSGQVYPVNPDRISSTNSIVASLDSAYMKAEKSTPKKTA